MERVDAISYYMDKLIGYTTQAILGMFMLGNDPLSRAISSSENVERSDKDLMRSIVYQSYKQDPRYAGKDHKALTDRFMAEEERKEAAKQTHETWGATPISFASRAGVNSEPYEVPTVEHATASKRVLCRPLRGRARMRVWPTTGYKHTTSGTRQSGWARLCEGTAPGAPQRLRWHRPTA